MSFRNLYRVGMGSTVIKFELKFEFYASCNRIVR